MNSIRSSYRGTSIQRSPKGPGKFICISRVRYIESLDLTNFWENNQNVRYIELGIVNDYFPTPSIS